MNRAIEVMNKKVVTISPEASLKEAYLLMKGNEIRHLPVVDQLGKIVGIISDRDVQRSMEVKVINDFQQEVSLPSNYQVQNFMSWPVYTVSPSTPVLNIAKAMLSEKISAIVVQHTDGTVAGIMTSTDMLALLVDVLTRENNESQKSNQWTQWTLGAYLNQAKKI